MSFLLICSEPGAPPENVRASNTSSTSISVKWDKVPVKKQHGEIINYKVSYWVTEGDGRRESVTSSIREVELKKLVKYTYYNISVSARTIKGYGPASNPYEVRTDEDSK